MRFGSCAVVSAMCVHGQCVYALTWAWCLLAMGGCVVFTMFGVCVLVTRDRVPCSCGFHLIMCEGTHACMKSMAIVKVDLIEVTPGLSCNVQ